MGLLDQILPRKALGPAVNVHGGSGDVTRGTWCTPKWLCDLMGIFDLDPCSNERSHVHAALVCMNRPHVPGDDGLELAKRITQKTCRTFINPDYADGSVIRWVQAYCHTDFTFLLRYDPSTAWFKALLPHTRYLWFPLGRRINFEPPPGVKSSSSTMPHALFLRSPPNDALQAAGLTLAIPEIHRAGPLVTPV